MTKQLTEFDFAVVNDQIGSVRFIVDFGRLVKEFEKFFRVNQ
jgi:hypothetical protein